jgi:hypothetical protein
VVIVEGIVTVVVTVVIDCGSVIVFTGMEIIVVEVQLDSVTTEEAVPCDAALGEVVREVVEEVMVEVVREVVGEVEKWWK